MNLNKLLFVFALITLIGVVTACSEVKNNKKDNNQDEAEQETSGNVQKEGFPIVEDEITLKMFTKKSDVNLNMDWEDLPVWNEYEDMTNVNLDWTEQVTTDSLDEKRNLALGGGVLPDVFYASNLSNSDLFKYGEQGVFLKLNDLIDEYAPNLKKIMEDDPNIKKGITFPDGNIYSMPALMSNDFVSVRIGARPWIDETWLERLDMKAPETTEEFYEFLTAIKNDDEDIVPYGGVNIDNLIGWLNGSYGLHYTGAGLTGEDPDGDGLRFIPTSDKYREMLEYIHKLFDEELIEQNIFSIESEQFLANAAEGKYGSTVFYDPAFTFGGKGKDFTGISALKGPDGDQLYVDVAPSLSNNGQFVITEENPNPEATVRWMDYFYSDEGAKLLYMGIEGESFIEEDGEFRYTDEIENADDSEKEMSKYVPWVGVNPPGLLKEDYFSGSEASETSLEAAEKLEPYIPDNIMSGVTYTKDENTFMNSTGTDIQKYVNEMRDKFISGEESLDDSNWENYVETIESMGLDEYLSIQKGAYERYNDH